MYETARTADAGSGGCSRREMRSKWFALAGRPSFKGGRSASTSRLRPPCMRAFRRTDRLTSAQKRKTASLRSGFSWTRLAWTMRVRPAQDIPGIFPCFL
jgi:hypothetical protein